MCNVTVLVIVWFWTFLKIISIVTGHSFFNLWWSIFITLSSHIWHHMRAFESFNKEKDAFQWTGFLNFFLCSLLLSFPSLLCLLKLGAIEFDRYFSLCSLKVASESEDFLQLYRHVEDILPYQVFQLLMMLHSYCFSARFFLKTRKWKLCFYLTIEAGNALTFNV